MGVAAMGGRDEPVLRAPDEQGGQARGEVHLVERAHRLAAVVDHRPQGPQERGPGLRVGQGDVGVPGLVGLGTAHTGRGQPPAQPLAGGDDLVRGDDRQHEFRPGCRHQTQRASEFGPQASAADQDKSLDVLRMLVGELHGDTATEGMPDQRDAGDAELVEKVAQPYREGSQ